jgi:G3E family GTPase
MENRWEQPGAEVMLLTGFLGAGKTTLVSRILGLDMDFSRTVVLVNEFGSAGIDGALIRRTATAEVVEMANGCICCTLKADLLTTLNRLWERFRPRRVILEATGVADPLAIVSALGDPGLFGRFSLSRTVTVVDADFWEAREAFGHVFFNQLSCADLILVNKIDTLDRETVPRVLEEVRKACPGKPVIPTLQCNVDPGILFPRDHGHGVSQGPGPAGADPSGTGLPVYDPGRDVTGDYLSGKQDKGASGAETGPEFVSFSWSPGGTVDRGRFETFLAWAPATLFRIKGPVRFRDETCLVHGVGGRIAWEPWQGDPGTCLAFVGWDVDAGAILERVNACADPG